MDASRPIGVFDSGIGGLTVVRQLQEQFPHENIIYFGDTARVPYGTKSHKVIEEFGLQDAEFLVQQGVKCIVIACNTASAHAMDAIKHAFPEMPVIGMIESGATYANQMTKNNHVGVIGTPATIQSDLYAVHLKQRNSNMKVFSEECPLFVPLAEEGFSDGKVAESIIEHYLSPFLRSGIDTLILGCTHYPLLKDVIQSYLGNSVYLVDSGKAAAISVKEILTEKHLLNTQNVQGELKCFLSCITRKFESIAETCLKHPIESLELVDIDTHFA